MTWNPIRKLLCSGLLVLVGATAASAKEAAFVKESIRARGMGNAFTAAANDESVLFYNPAGLRSVMYNIFELTSVQVASNVSSGGLEGSVDADNTKVENLAEITGKNIHVEAGLNLPSFVNSRFGWALFSNTLFDFQIRNPVFPYLHGTAYVQGGLAGAVGFSFMDHQLDVGVGGKLVQRVGVYNQDFRLSDPAVIATLNDDTDQAQKEIEAIGDNKLSFAPDLGATYHLEEFHNLSPKVAISLQNIGGLNFGNAGEVPMTINTGIATESEFQGFDFLLAADYLDLLGAQELSDSFLTQRNLKLGAEIGWEKLNNGHHLVSFRLGRNGPYSSWGLSLNLWKLKLDFAQYSEEIGSYAGEKEDKRWAFQAGFLF